MLLYRSASVCGETQYLDQYLAEFSFRYSTRKITDGERTRAGMAKMGGKRLMLRRPAARET